MNKIKAGPVRRLLLRWHQGQWIIINEKRIPKMAIPNTQLIPQVKQKERTTGFWFEVSDKKGKNLYRQILNDPLSQQMEVPNPDGTFTNIPELQKDFYLEVIIPDKPENTTLSILSTEPQLKEKRAVKKIPQFDLRKDYRSKNKKPGKKNGE